MIPYKLQTLLAQPDCRYSATGSSPSQLALRASKEGSKDHAAESRTDQPRSGKQLNFMWHLNCGPGGAQNSLWPL